MKIVFLTNKLARGGAEKQIRLLISRLAKDNIVRLVVFSSAAHADVDLSDYGVAVTYFGNQASMALPSKWYDIYHLIRDLRSFSPDIVHAWLFRPNLIAAIIKPFLKKAVLIVSERNMLFWHNFWHSLACRFIYAYADIIMVNTQAVGDEISNRFNVRGKIRRVPNGIDISLRSKTVIPHPSMSKLKQGSKIIVGCIGRFVPQKRYEDILQTARLLLASKKDLQFVLVGGRGNLSYYRALAQDYGILERVAFIGEVDDVIPYMTAFDIFLHASAAEGLPNVIMEAMLMGKPVVATAVGGTPDLIKDGFNGLLVPPYRPDLLAAALQTLVADEDLRILFSCRNRRRICEYRWDRMVGDVQKMYNEGIGLL